MPVLYDPDTGLGNASDNSSRSFPPCSPPHVGGLADCALLLNLDGLEKRRVSSAAWWTWVVHGQQHHTVQIQRGLGFCTDEMKEGTQESGETASMIG